MARLDGGGGGGQRMWAEEEGDILYAMMRNSGNNL